MAVVAQSFDLRQMLVAMSKINWEVKDVMSQHNAYIDVILRVNALLFARFGDGLLFGFFFKGDTNFCVAFRTNQHESAGNYGRKPRFMGKHSAYNNAYASSRVKTKK